MMITSLRAKGGQAGRAKGEEAARIVIFDTHTHENS
jgi:hypothetical protein